MGWRFAQRFVNTLIVAACAITGAGCYLAHELEAPLAPRDSGTMPSDGGPAACFPGELLLEVGDEPGCRSVDLVNPKSFTCPNRGGTLVAPARALHLHRRDPEIDAAFFVEAIRGEGECVDGGGTCQTWLTKDSDPETCVCEYGFTGATLALGGARARLTPPIWNERGTDAYFLQGGAPVILRFWACVDAEPEP